jgi:hypothetical protein
MTKENMELKKAIAQGVAEGVAKGIKAATKQPETSIIEHAQAILAICMKSNSCDGCPLWGPHECAIHWPPSWDLNENE